MNRVHTLLLVAMLLGITIIWGWTFLIVKDAVASYSVLTFLALRFTLAAGLLLPFAVRQWSWKVAVRGAGIGAAVALGYLFQTFGLTGTSAAHAGLLTGLFVIFTPVLDRLLYRAPLAPVTLLSVMVGVGGTALLTLNGLSTSISWGDALELLTAVAFALQIVWLGHYSRGLPSTPLAASQMIPAAAGFWILTLTTQTTLRMPSPSVWLAIVITGGLASALAFWVQTFVQQRITSARTAVILLAEPLFATIFAVWLGGERLSAIQWTGAVLILASLLVHEAWVASRPAAAPLVP